MHVIDSFYVEEFLFIFLCDYMLSHNLSDALSYQSLPQP